MAADRWEQALNVYQDRRMALLVALGFSSGLPRLLIFSTLTFWLLEGGVSLGRVGMFAMVAAPYSLKFLWAPLLDHVSLPGVTTILGQRRGWLLMTQLALMGAIFALAWAGLNASASVIAACAMLVAVLSATQDTIIDAYRVELLEPSAQGAGAASAVMGYRLGMVVAGSGAMMLAAMTSWALAYVTMALLMGVGVIATCLAAPVHEEARAPVTLHDALIEPARALTRRPGWAVILGCVLCYKLGDALAAAMLNPMLLALDFSTLEIASVAQGYGVAASVIGVLLGGALVKRLGVTRALWIGAFMQVFSNLVLVLQAHVGHHLGVLIATISVENICGGVGAAAFVAFLSRLCDKRYTATQYALLTALSSLLVTICSGGAGGLAQLMPWTTYYMLTMLAGLPALGLIAWLLHRERRGAL